MANYKLVVLSNPVAGRDAEYNDWYNTIHLQDVTAVPGYRSAQRFKLTHPMGFEHQWQYLALYEVETDDPDAAIQNLLSRQNTELMHISEALDVGGAVGGLFAPCSPVVEARAPQPAAHV
jgi:hypothetical protein